MKIKSHNEELNERLETAECQIATISQEYRKLLSDRDTELKRYKSENDKLREERKHFVDSISPNSPLKRLVDPFGNGGMFETVDISGSMDGGVGWAGDELQDFSDVVNSQGEINRLQSDLAKLKIECQHWKDTASKVCLFLNVYVIGLLMNTILIVAHIMSTTYVYFRVPYLGLM